MTNIQSMKVSKLGLFRKLSDAVWCMLANGNHGKEEHHCGEPAGSISVETSTSWRTFRKTQACSSPTKSDGHSTGCTRRCLGPSGVPKNDEKRQTSQKHPLWEDLLGKSWAIQTVMDTSHTFKVVHQKAACPRLRSSWIGQGRLIPLVSIELADALWNLGAPWVKSIRLDFFFR